MAQRTFFAIMCVVLTVHATAWGQGPGYAQGPYGPPAGPWASGPVQASYQSGPSQPETIQSGPMMQQGPMMQPGPMQPGPVYQPGEAMCDPSCAGNSCCAGNQCASQWEGFGDFLYMRPRSANVAYGVVYNDISQPGVRPGSATPIQLAEPGVASIDFHPGFRAGIAKSLDECNAVVATFTHYEGEDQNSISTGQFLIRSMVSQPATWVSSATSDWGSAASDYSMISSLADVDLRWTFENQCDTRLSLLVGARYASLDQRLDVVGVALRDIQSVHTQVNFEGGGLRIGFEGQRRTPLGLVFYGRTAASLVAGTFRCAYTETSGLTGVLVETGYPADRVVPMIDAEIGTGLSLWNDKLRLTTGYTFSGWFNAVRTDHLISAVQNNDFTGMSNLLTFDGFVGRVELSF